MKNALLLLSLMFSLIISPLMVDAAVRVNGYFRKDGTYVAPHYRSSPDGNPYNNYSFPGNTNPYTGEVAPGNAQTYLDTYYNSSGSNTTYSLPVSTYTPLLSPRVTYTTPTPATPKYKGLLKAPAWVEYVGQHDACSYVYDTYGKNLAQLKAQYAPAPYKIIYGDTKEYAAAVIAYNFNTEKVDMEVEALWSEAEKTAYACYQSTKAPRVSTALLTTQTASTAGSGVTLAELVELFVALGIIPAEKAEQARSVLMMGGAQ